jgi:hypothetical protein
MVGPGGPGGSRSPAGAAAANPNETTNTVNIRRHIFGVVFISIPPSFRPGFKTFARALYYQDSCRR